MHMRVCVRVSKYYVYYVHACMCVCVCMYMIGGALI